VLYVLSTGKSHQDFPEPLSDLSAQENHGQWLEFNAVVHKACQAQVSDRYQTAEQMRDELALLQRGQSIKAKRVLQQRWRIARTLTLAALTIALLLTPLIFLNKSTHAHLPTAEADRLYEYGRWHYNQLTPADHAKALDYLSKAIEADPAFIEPYGELTGVYLWSLLTGIVGSQERLQKTKEIADKVIAINPNRAEGHIALSVYNFLRRDWQGAETEMALAIQLDPNLAIPHQFYGFYLTMEGRISEAHRECHRAEELSPPTAARVSAILASWPFVAERRFDLAIAHLQRALELDPNFALLHSYLSDWYEAQTNYPAAIKECRIYLTSVGHDPARVASSCDALNHAYDAQGESGYLRQWIELILADQALPDDQQIFADMDISGYYARLGEKEKALDEIEKTFDGFPGCFKIKFEPLYDSLHNEPRYKALVRRAGLNP
jgi:tetratricopeptide (TPR) repeat protein